MPYIKLARREILDQSYPDGAQTAGELNYLITSLCLAYWHGDEPSYARLNDTIGALECAKAEFYRRVVVPYEETKMKENGDVYS